MTLVEWTKAKKYTIIILVVLNAVLLCLNIYKSFETKLSSGRISDVISLFEKDNITIACTLPKSYKPMAQIYTSDYSFDFIKVEKAFMEGETNVKRTDEYNSVVFMSDNSRLSIKGSTINYTASLSKEISLNTEARNYGDNLIKRINESFGNYTFHSLSKNSEGYIIKYYEKSDNHNIFSNFVYFTIKGNNAAVALNYVKIGSEVGEKRDIYAADEALYSASELIKEEIDKPNITSVELGYYAIRSNVGSESLAVPFYLIMANGREYYVNGYTGECF
ncbi:MAG: two-component system regulatory protein YycI [Clostridia bacterium]|nr:two-component system regulatory protein YycI [Clostridia bacterium]